MISLAKFALLSTACFLATLVAGQECVQLNSGLISAATDYIEHADDGPEAASCVRLAFHQIATASPEKAIPLLINYLGYRRPLNEAERRGIFMHGKNPSELYPAVHELAGLGSNAEAALIEFIGRSKVSNSENNENALYAILLIHHGNVVSAIRRLRTGAENSMQPETRNRLEAAAKKMSRWCDEHYEVECRNALQ